MSTHPSGTSSRPAGSGIVCVIVGTRPGIIKQSPTIRALARASVPHIVLHTGQHYSPEMDARFFEDLELAPPTHRIDGGRPGSLHGAQTARMIEGVERVLVDERPDLVLVIGDANTNMAAALAARKLHIRVGHIEAGLRSRDWRMPEEHNRVMIDHISEYLFAPTEAAVRNLTAEAVRGRIVLTGNPIVDAVQESIELARHKSDILSQLDVSPGGFLLLTTHREENVDDPQALASILEGAARAGRAIDATVIFPAHPRTRGRLDDAGLTANLALQGIRLIPPAGYLDCLALAEAARVVLTDSGGLQEEACILMTPCVTLRPTTEWVETVDVGANVAVGIAPDAIEGGVVRMAESARMWSSPYGSGGASDLIVSEVARALVEPPPEGL